MASLNVNGVVYDYPDTGDEEWGSAATNWASAVTSGMLQKQGGTFTLTAEAYFGASFGLRSLYFKGASSNPAATGQVRLANADVGVVWRNAANNADLPLTVDSSNRLSYNGVPIASSSGIVPPAAGGTGVANNAASTITISGSYALTLTLSAATGVTLPTSGTLATLAGTETLSNKIFVGATANPASAGNVRLSNTDSIAWRNAGNNDNVLLSVRSDNSLKISGGVAAGSDQILFLSHADNTNAASDAYFLIQTGGTSGGDPYVRCDVPGGTSWSFGTDTSASTGFSITNAASLGGVAQYLSITTSGILTFGQGTSVPHRFNTAVQSTVGAAGAAAALPATPEEYWVVDINGTQRAIPAYIIS